MWKWAGCAFLLAGVISSSGSYGQTQKIDLETVCNENLRLGSGASEINHHPHLAFATVTISGSQLKLETTTPMLATINEDQTLISMAALADARISSDGFGASDCTLTLVDPFRLILVFAGMLAVVGAPMVGSCLRVRAVFLGLTFVFSAAIAVLLVVYYTWQTVGGAGDAKVLALGVTAPLALMGLLQTYFGVTLKHEHVFGLDLVPPYPNWVVVGVAMIVLLAVLVATVATSCVTKAIIVQASSALETAMVASGLIMVGFSSSLLALNVSMAFVLGVTYLVMTWTCCARTQGGRDSDGDDDVGVEPMQHGRHEKRD